MEQNSLKKGIWDSAAKAGLVFGIIASAYMFITQFMAGGSWPAILQMAVNALLWMLKFVGCIWLMMFYMKKLVKDYPQADNSSTFRFGCITAALSALIYAAVSFANYAFISPEFLSGQMDAVMQQMAPMLDSNTMAERENDRQNASDHFLLQSYILFHLRNSAFCNTFPHDSKQRSVCRL